MAERDRPRILVIDDDPAMVTLLRSLLDADGYDRIDVAATSDEALERSDAADLVLLDHQLPDGTGLDLLPRLLARPHAPSVIMVTGEGSEELAAASLRLGADDYVVKDQRLREMLPMVVERTRRNRMLRDTRAEVENELLRAERLAAVGEMTVTLHHELNNPLMAALAEIDLLLAETSLAADTFTAIERVREALLRMRDIVKRAGELRRADSSAYLAGLRMIDLAAGDASAVAGPAHRGRGVLCCSDHELARAVALLLRHAGFSVDHAPSADTARMEAERIDVSLVVLAVSGVPPDPLGGFRPAPDRRYTLVALVRADPDPARAAGADLVLTRPFDPSSFTTDILRAIAARSAAVPAAPRQA
ncbi:MAG: response regulator [Gemmatimonadales bacterium]